MRCHVFKLTLKLDSFHRGESSSSILHSDLQRIFFSLKVLYHWIPGLTQSLEDGQAFIHLFPRSSTLDAVNVVTSKLLQMESNRDQWSKGQVLCFKCMAFIQLDKYDWDGQVINHWFRLAVSVSYKSKQWWELQQSSTGRCCLDVPTHSQNSEVKRNEGQWRRINSLNMILKIVKFSQLAYWASEIKRNLPRSKI